MYAGAYLGSGKRRGNEAMKVYVLIGMPTDKSRLSDSALELDLERPFIELGIAP